MNDALYAGLQQYQPGSNPQYDMMLRAGQRAMSQAEQDARLKALGGPAMRNVAALPITRPCITMEVGILLCRQVRDYLESCRWHGADIEWREGRGWIDRQWEIRGAPSDMQRIAHDLRRWASEMDASEAEAAAK